MTSKDNLLAVRQQVEDAIADLDAWRVPAEFNAVALELIFSPMEATQALYGARNHIDATLKALDAEYERPAKSPAEQCQCKGGEDNQPYDISECPRHTVDHGHKQDCCDEPEEQHRHWSDAEYDEAYPKLLDTFRVTPAGRYNVEARQYLDGVSVCITHVIGEDTGAGLCFDLPLDALRGIMPALEKACALESHGQE